MKLKSIVLGFCMVLFGFCVVVAGSLALEWSQRKEKRHDLEDRIAALEEENRTLRDQLVEPESPAPEPTFAAPGVRPVQRWSRPLPPAPRRSAEPRSGPGPQYGDAVEAAQNAAAAAQDARDATMRN